MTTQPPAVDDANIQWKDAKSTNGVAFQTGTVVTDIPWLDALLPRVTVNWPVANPPVWVNTPELVGSVAISGYMLSRSGGKLFDYTLSFKNVGGKRYNYFFHDESGDGYTCDTWQDSIHFVHYNSNKPTIFKIAALTLSL